MVLGFKSVFPWGAPTNFEQKIINAIKLHTLRQDPHNRWRAGMPIQLATGVRTKKYRCFKEDVCTGTQLIRITPKYLMVEIFGTTDITACLGGLILWHGLSNEEIDTLARNDGFDSTEDFWRWFNKPFEGKLIHWTQKRY